MSISKNYQSTKGTCKVTFTYATIHAAGAKTVQVLGSFNNWDPNMAPKMKKSKDVFTVVIELLAGQTYEFKYLIDGSRWDNDHNADSYEASPYYGSQNSILILDNVVKPSKPTAAKSSKTEKTSIKSSTKAEKTSTKAAPKAPKVEKAPKAPKVEKVAPKTTPKPPKAEKIAKPEKVAPKSTLKPRKPRNFAPKLDPIAPKAEKVATKAATKAEKVAPKSAPKAPKAEKVAPKSAPKAAKVEKVAPKVATKAASVSAKAGTKVAPKTTPKVPKAVSSLTPKTPKAEKVAPKSPAKSISITELKSQSNDLVKIEGIGPKIALFLNSNNIHSFEDLKKAKVEDLKAILERAGSKFNVHNPTSWPTQAGLAAAGKWDELKKLQDSLNAGKAKK